MRQTEIENMKNTSIKNKLQPADTATIIYILLTGLIIVAGWNKLRAPGMHLLLRGLALFVMYLLIRYADKANGLLYLLRNFYTILFLILWYPETDYLNNLLFDYFDPLVAAWEQALFGTQPSLIFAQHFNFRWFSELMSLGYFSFYLIIFFVLLAILRTRPNHFAYSLYLVVASFYVYYLVFIFFPVAGPQYYFKETVPRLPDGYLFSHLMHFIEQTAERPTAAFPSSHVGISLLMVWLAWKYVRKAFYYVLPFAVLLIISTVYLRAHYVIDVLAGGAAFPLLLLLGNKSYFLLTGPDFQTIGDT